MSRNPMNPALQIRPTRSEDVPVIRDLIHQLAMYEKLEHMITGSEA
ncbi:MAG: GNAT family N-acetyltransferase, partial [Betaproteobacteria bacterium]|nr:GNAT family N-acetyltransferase [Betaproteobacteria bacterium]